MITYQKNKNTYALTRRKTRYGGLVSLRKTNERVNIHEYIGGKQYRRVVWVDLEANWYVRWRNEFRLIDKHYGTDVWHMRCDCAPLADA